MSSAWMNIWYDINVYRQPRRRGGRKRVAVRVSVMRPAPPPGIAEPAVPGVWWLGYTRRTTAMTTAIAQRAPLRSWCYSQAGLALAPSFEGLAQAVWHLGSTFRQRDLSRDEAALRRRGNGKNAVGHLVRVAGRR
jgi:hypothetical protein